MIYKKSMEIQNNITDNPTVRNFTVKFSIIVSTYAARSARVTFFKANTYVSFSTDRLLSDAVLYTATYNATRCPTI